MKLTPGAYVAMALGSSIGTLIGTLLFHWATKR